MGKWIHRIKDGFCIKCGVSGGIQMKAGRIRCKKAQRHWRGNLNNRKPHQKVVSRKQCSKCGFIPKHICQLDIHHKNGNHQDNKKENLEILCANCHRLIVHKKKT